MSFGERTNLYERIAMRNRLAIDKKMTRIEFTTRCFINIHEGYGYSLTRKGVVKGKAYKDGPPGVICNVVEKYVRNQFGEKDSCLYYVLAKNKWFRYWASDENARISKYQEKDGVTIQEQIIKSLKFFLQQGLVCLVIGFTTDYADLTYRNFDKNKHNVIFYYLNSDKLIEFITKYKTHFPFRSRYNENHFGFPKDLFSIEDPFKKFKPYHE